MIVPMKKVSVIVQAHNKSSMLKTLRKEGVMHIFTESVRTEKSEGFKKQLDLLNKVRSSILDKVDPKKVPVQKRVSEEVFVELHERYLQLLDTRGKLEEEVAKDNAAIEQLRPWGDFDPDEIAALEQEGVSLAFYTLSKKDLKALEPSIAYIELAPLGAMQAIAVVDAELPSNAGATRFSIPEMGLAALEERNAYDKQRLVEINASLKEGGVYLDAYQHRMDRTEQELHFDQVSETSDGGDDLCWITGYIPEPQEKTFTKFASNQGWAYLLEDPSDEDEPPTQVKYAKGVGIIKPVFDILGTVPGYRENDISLWFLLFFTLFFAMIIGDAGYGLVFLLAAGGMHIKAKKANTMVLLIYVLSIATIVWGSLTGTWFGSKMILESVPFLKQLVIPSISNYPELFGLDAVTAQNQVMKFCFIIGTVQLSLACVLNIVHKAPKKDLSLFADVGWMIDVLALYFIVLQLVVGESVNFTIAGGAVGLGFLLVVVFGAQGPGIPFGKGLASGLGGFFTTFLNTISCFSNIMSYIRLFAVGMASVAIAQSFNSMAGGMLSGFAAIAGVLVLVIGHSLNLVMGLLSVVVHGVRLNLLEFSGQLGMEWTGISYEPFSQTVQEN
ncbi:MAG TPA: ATPase [Sphaerochaeta sp.]|nr:ATPase [Sphaerochaeta sp.]